MIFLQIAKTAGTDFLFYFSYALVLLFLSELLHVQGLEVYVRPGVVLLDGGLDLKRLGSHRSQLALVVALKKRKINKKLWQNFMCLTRSFPSSTQYWLEGQVEVVTELTYWVSLHIVVGGQSQSQTHFNPQPFLCRLGNEIAAEKIFLKISQMVRSFQQVICWQPRTSGKKQTPGKVFGNQRQGLGMQLTATPSHKEVSSLDC